MKYRFLFAACLPLITACSSPDPAELVAEPRDRIGVGLALLKDCELVKPQEYSAVFGWVVTSTEILTDGTFDRNIEQANALRNQFGCDSAEVNTIASLTTQAMAIDYQSRQTTGQMPAQPGVEPAPPEVAPKAAPPVALPDDGAADPNAAEAEAPLAEAPPEPPAEPSPMATETAAPAAEAAEG